MDSAGAVIGGWGEAFTHHSTISSCYRESSTLVVLEHSTRALDTRVTRPDARHLDSPSIHCVIRTPDRAACLSRVILIPIQTRVLHVSLTRMDAGALGAIPARGIRAGASHPVLDAGDSPGDSPGHTRRRSR